MKVEKVYIINKGDNMFDQLLERLNNIVVEIEDVKSQLNNKNLEIENLKLQVNSKEEEIQSLKVQLEESKNKLEEIDLVALEEMINRLESILGE